MLLSKWLVSLLVKTLISIVVLTLLYIFCILLPVKALVGDLLEIERRLYSGYTALASFRLAYFELLRVDVQSTNFVIERGRNIDEFANAKKVWLENPSSLGKLKSKTPFVGKEAKDSDILLAKTQSFFEEADPLINGLKHSQMLFGKIYDYNFSLDVGYAALEGSLSKEEVAFRVEAAIDGIGLSLTRMKDSSKISDYSEYERQVGKVQGSMRDFILFINRNDLILASQTATKVNIELQELKKEALNIEKRLLSSDGNVKIITRETNLLLEYDFQIEKIKRKLRLLYRLI